MTFTYKNDHFAQLGMDFRFIYATGVFTEGTANKFSLFVKQNKIMDEDRRAAVVIFDSDGGSIAEALSMGRMIRKMGFETEVDTHCFSACTLAFLGGVRREVVDRAEFGVHRVFATRPLDNPDEALDVGQIVVADIVKYAESMGVDPSFVTAMTAKGPRDINILSHDQLLKYKIISMPFTTQWEFKAMEGHFYLSGTSKTNNGYHKMIFTCESPGVMYIMMLYNVSGDYKEDVLNSTTIYRLAIDNKEYPLRHSEILDPVRASGDSYVSVVIHPDDPIYRALADARDVRFEMMPSASSPVYAGWDTDFASGRDKYNEFEQSCHMTATSANGTR